ncbi:elongation factor P 5-aminopentanone reductase [Alkalihalobacterium alkalinitrilicum]|uniref:elongation factor P 5-aminopentanone reductase n=1 Tax=Alkalihalobacterium alkalinitrilicum TaxID=427920 RepID=UPI00099513C5|nr:SDR family oxidoreductase [Alkalihalobacterium alkalinitrilicum]
MNQTCLITGASGDIGAAIAKKMAARGFSLILHYYKNKENVLKIADECRLYNIDIQIVQADLSKRGAATALKNELSKPIDVIIHNSGSSYYGLLTDMNDEEIEKNIQLHLTTPIQLTKLLLPSMVAKQSGNIVVISSIWGLVGASCEVVYSAVKGGLNSFVKALAKELGPTGIRVNGVAPGAIKTNMLSSFNHDELEMLEEEIPMGRLGTPFEVANTVSFLSSNEASYINGQIISVNGAWYC